MREKLQTIRALPRARVVSIVRLLEWLSERSGSKAGVPELTDALTQIYDAEAVPLFDGSGQGLVEPVGGADGSGFNRRVEMICDLFNSRFWLDPDAKIEGMSPREVFVDREDANTLAQSLWRLFFPGTGFSLDVGELYDEPPATEPAAQGEATDAAKPCGIEGPTFARLARAIAAFPDRYPRFQTKAPKLDADIRPWLSESGLAENDAERRVFGAIIREHFKLSPDTQKSQ